MHDLYSADYVWAKVIAHLEQQLTDVTVSAWFDDAKVIDLTEKHLIVYSPTDFRQNTIRNHCTELIEEYLHEHFRLDAKLLVWGESELKASQEETTTRKPLWSFHPQFTFDNYIAGQSNQLALRVSVAAANDPGAELYNPLFLYGPPGVGKTHLLLAMANKIAENNPATRILYVKGEQFTNDLITAIRDNKTPQFRQKYRQVDVLLVDDIQFISGKEATQEEFFHTFNELYEHHKQIVMTADRKPSEMSALENRLRTRFGSGILVGITPPDLETRLLIVKNKAAKLGLALNDTVAKHIATELSDSVRSIEGALKKIRAFRDLTNMELTLDNIMQIIEDIRLSDSNTMVTANTIIRNVCKYYGIEEEKLKGKQRSKNISEPRQIAMYFVRSLLGMSFPEIGKIFERDHSSVQYSVKSVEELLEAKDRRLIGIIQDIRASIENGI